MFNISGGPMQNIEVASDRLNSYLIPFPKEVKKDYDKYSTAINDNIKGIIEKQIKKLDECIEEISKEKLNNLSVKNFCSLAEKTVEDYLSIIALRIQTFNQRILNNSKEISELNSTFHGNHGAYAFVYGTKARKEEFKKFLEERKPDFEKIKAKEGTTINSCLTDYMNQIGEIAKLKESISTTLQLFQEIPANNELKMKDDKNKIALSEFLKQNEVKESIKKPANVFYNWIFLRLDQIRNKQFNLEEETNLRILELEKLIVNKEKEHTAKKRLKLEIEPEDSALPKKYRFEIDQLKTISTEISKRLDKEIYPMLNDFMSKYNCKDEPLLQQEFKKIEDTDPNFKYILERSPDLIEIFLHQQNVVDGKEKERINKLCDSPLYTEQKTILINERAILYNESEKKYDEIKKNHKPIQEKYKDRIKNLNKRIEKRLVNKSELEELAYKLDQTLEKVKCLGQDKLEDGSGWLGWLGLSSLILNKNEDADKAKWFENFRIRTWKEKNYEIVENNNL